MEELLFLLENGRLAAAVDDPRSAHLESPVALCNYIRIADEVAAYARRGPMLDWGCGHGQMSYLLRRRGMDVIGYEVSEGLPNPRLPMTRGLRVIRSEDPVALPFGDEAFETVLSCGVLEHVPDEDGSLSEIRRVLAPHGRLLIYNLPQRWSYKEILIGGLGAGYVHERRYTLSSATAALHRSGLRLVRARRRGVLPHLGTGLPRSLMRLYERRPQAVVAADGVLSRLPLVAHVGQSLEIVAER